MKYLILLLFLYPSLGFGQGYSFSQFHSSPLSMNPALNGTSVTSIRISSIFRNQWIHGGTPYLTGAFGVDKKILASKIPDFHSFGIGANFILDQSNAGGLRNNSYNIGSAYHISLDAGGAHILGVGVQGSFHQRMINLSKLNFESQFTSGGFNNSLPIGEAFQNLNSHYFDANAGLIYQLNTQKVQFNIGASVFNLSQPQNNSLFTIYRVPRRYIFHSGFSTSINQGSAILGSLTSISTAGINNLTAGVAFKKEKEDISITAGCWYRMRDAIIPYLGLSRNGLTVGLSFDNTISTLKAVSQTRNAFELSFIYTPLGEYKQQKRFVPWY